MIFGEAKALVLQHLVCFLLVHADCRAKTWCRPDPAFLAVFSLSVESGVHPTPRPSRHGDRRGPGEPSPVEINRTEAARRDHFFSFLPVCPAFSPYFMSLISMTKGIGDKVID